MTVRNITTIPDLIRIVKESPIPIILEIVNNRTASSDLSGFYRQLSQLFEGKVGFLSVNIDRVPEILNIIRVQYLPTYVGFDKGEIVEALQSPYPLQLKHFVEMMSRLI